MKEDNKLKILCVVQARYSSTRLPGKVLMTLGGKPDIEQVFNQVSYSKYINKAILATSTDKSDDKLVEWALKYDVEYYRGHLDDVLDRYYQAAKMFNPEVVVRITADCPLIDPDIIDKVIVGYFDGDFNYVSNVMPPTFPDGLDVEVFSFSVLENVWQIAKLKSDREHVTSYIRNNLNMFKTKNISNSENLSKMRWTLDNKEDYIFLNEVFCLLQKEKGYIKYSEVLAQLEKNPELGKINSHIDRNEGYFKSIINEQ